MLILDVLSMASNYGYFYTPPPELLIGLSSKHSQQHHNMIIATHLHNLRTPYDNYVHSKGDLYQIQWIKSWVSVLSFKLGDQKQGFKSFI